MISAEFVYCTLLRPRPLKKAANTLIRAVIPKILSRHGIKVALNPQDPVISGALTFGVYEKAEIRFLQSVCRPGQTFLDVGANVGLYTALVGKGIQAQGKIVALEPDLSNFEYLKKTVSANRLANVICVPKAAAARCGVMKLFVSEDNRGDNRLYQNELSSGSYEVQVVTVDSLLEELGVHSLDLVKIDVQGFEGHVLGGMSDTLRRSPNVILLMEFWPHGLRSAQTDPEELIRHLKEAGLNLWELTRNGSLVQLGNSKQFIDRYPGRKYTNIVATRSQTVAGVKVA